MNTPMMKRRDKKQGQDNSSEAGSLRYCLGEKSEEIRKDKSTNYKVQPFVVHTLVNGILFPFLLSLSLLLLLCGFPASFIFVKAPLFFPPQLHLFCNLFLFLDCYII